MDSQSELKICRKNLHTYSSKLKQCPECKKISTSLWTQKNKEKCRENSRQWANNNRERTRINSTKWSKKNEQKKKEYNKEWRKRNKEKIKSYVKKPRNTTAYKAKYRASKKQAIPPWANLKAIKEIYKKCAQMTNESGIVHQVDHIYPLNSKYMCGLHVETNLQIITREENILKNNKTWAGQLPCQKD